MMVKVGDVDGGQIMVILIILKMTKIVAKIMTMTMIFTWNAASELPSCAVSIVTMSSREKFPLLASSSYYHDIFSFSKIVFSFSNPAGGHQSTFCFFLSPF